MTPTRPLGSTRLAAAVGQPEPDTVRHVEHVEGCCQLGTTRPSDHSPLPSRVGQFPVRRGHTRDTGTPGPGDGHEAGSEVALVVGVCPHGHDVAQRGDLHHRVGHSSRVVPGSGQFGDLCHADMVRAAVRVPLTRADERSVRSRVGVSEAKVAVGTM